VRRDGITPIGLPEDLPVFIDAPIVALDRVIVGGGSRRLKLRLRPKSFEALAQVTVVDISRDPPRS
jgi:prolyl-tRNA editing enzyme YbaK/EbsC (Cys-tRNA(Pro) deacylase)